MLNARQLKLAYDYWCHLSVDSEEALYEDDYTKEERKEMAEDYALLLQEARGIY